jgi:hypothetical protein
VAFTGVYLNKSKFSKLSFQWFHLDEKSTKESYKPTYIYILYVYTFTVCLVCRPFLLTSRSERGGTRPRLMGPPHLGPYLTPATFTLYRWTNTNMGAAQLLLCDMVNIIHILVIISVTSALSRKESNLCTYSNSTAWKTRNRIRSFITDVK